MTHTNTHYVTHRPHGMDDTHHVTHRMNGIDVTHHHATRGWDDTSNEWNGCQTSCKRVDGMTHIIGLTWNGSHHVTHRLH